MQPLVQLNREGVNQWFRNSKQVYPACYFLPSSALLVHSSFLDPLLAVVFVQQLGKCLSGVRGKSSNIVCPVKDCML